MKTILCGLFLGTLVGYTGAAFAVPNNPSNSQAPVVSLKVQCQTTEDNCFDNVSTLLTWIVSPRNPASSSPLQVNIGPGVFSMPSNADFCLNKGYTTFIGSGIGNTVLSGGRTASGQGVLTITNCTQLVVQDLTVRTGGASASVNGITWKNGGSSTWTHVAVEADQHGWYDLNSGTCVRGKHRWYGSRITSTGKGATSGAYYSVCGESWFYGGEIAAISENSALTSGLVTVRGSGANGIVRLVGTAIRTISRSPTAIRVGDGFGAIYAQSGSLIEANGSIASVSVENAGIINQNIFGAKIVNNTSELRIPSVVFNLVPGGTGTATRLSVSGTGKVLSPFYWQTGSEPPLYNTTTAVSKLTSVRGFDLFVENDCNSSGCWDATSSDEPHLLLYNANCSTLGPWFDVVTRKCRGVAK